MSHYEERLQNDADAIRHLLGELHERVDRAVLECVEAVVSHDRRRAYQTILADRGVNRGTRRLDQLCHSFVVRHLPAAGHLRWVSSILRLNVALERVGDYAVVVCREAVQLGQPPPQSFVRDVRLLGQQAERVFAQSFTAFDQGSVPLARSTIEAAQDVDETFKVAYHDLVSEAERSGRPARELFPLLVMLRSLKRVSDQGANICQQALFAAAGEVKERKVFRMLFVDRRNDCLSQIAEAHAEKAFPESGDYSSAGWDPAPELPAAVARFLDARGHDVRARRPAPLTPRPEDRRHYHVVVGLEGDPAAHLESVPYLTAVVEWDVGPPPDLDAPHAEARLEESYRRIAEEMGKLMEVLQGPDAD